MDLKSLSDEQLRQLYAASQAEPKPLADRALDMAKRAYSETWPGKLVQSAVSGFKLPGDVMSGNAQLPSSEGVPGSVPFGDPNSAGGRVADLTFLANPVNPAVRAGDKSFAGTAKNFVPEKPFAPTAKALDESASKGFDAVRSMGVDLAPAAVRRIGERLERDLQSKGILEEHAPTAYATLARLRNPPEGSVVTLSDLHNLRQAFGNAAGSRTHPKDTLAGSRGVAAIDEYLKAIPNADIVAGPASGGAKVLTNAIGDYAAAARSDTVTGKADLAALRAKVSNSGQNLDNATRQRFVDIASEGKAARGFSDPEVAQAYRLAEGAPGTNAARYIGNLLGGGGGLGMAVTGGMGAVGGSMLGGPVGAGVGATAGPVVGAVLKKIANALTKREVAKLDDMVRKRSPLYQDALENPAMVPDTVAKKAAIVRALLEAQEQR